MEPSSGELRSQRVLEWPQGSMQRALYKAMGYSDHDLSRPLVGIANSWNRVVPGHYNLALVADYVKQGILQAGGTPVEFGVIAACDGIAQAHVGMHYILPTRDLIAADVEMMVQAHQLDAVVLLGSCDKIVPGMLMGAARCNVPTLFVSGGPMEAGHLPDGRKVDLIDTFTAVAQHRAGQIDDAELTQIENAACPTCGSCSGMFTANSMNCLCEALGMALPGNGTILATSAAREDLYRAAAERIVAMASEGLRARDVMTLAAFDNAMTLDMAMGGSTNTLLHVPAIAHEAGHTYDLQRINDLSRRTPTVCKIAPSAGADGRIYHIEDLQAAGGIMTILGELARGCPGLLDLNCRTVTGQTLGENIAAHDLRAHGERLQTVGVSRGRAEDVESAAALRRADTATVAGAGPLVLAKIAAEEFDPFDCVRTCENAYSQTGGLTVLYGNLAPDGAVVKTAGVDPKMLRHTGPAVIFESQEAACEGILSGNLKPGDVVVIRYEGPRGGPGMQEMLAPTTYIKGMQLGDKCALITDGRFSGGTAGACIGHVSPEAAADGPIGLLTDGDLIEIDIPNCKLNVRLSEAELAKRQRHIPDRPKLTGYLARYAAQVTSANTGAILKL